MRSRRTTRAALAAVLVGAALLPLVAFGDARAAAVRPAEPLGHAGRWITDARQRVVMLRGVAVVPANGGITPESLGFARDDASFLAGHGFNVVRLGLFYEAWEVEPGVFDRDYLASYLRTQRTLARAGLFTVPDFHQDMLNRRFQGRGFADWFIQDDGVPNQPRVGFPGNYLVNPALNRAYDNLWANADAPDGVGLQDHFARGWRRVAARFERRRRVAGYDIFNEPWPGTVWPTCANPLGCPPGGFDQEVLTPFSNRVIAGIRKADRRHLVFYEPNLQFDVGAATRHRRVDDRKAGLSFHNYCLGAAPGLPRVPDPLELCRDVGERLVFQNAEEHSAETGAALLLTEFGDTADAEIHARITELADEFMVGWTMWAYIGSVAPLIREPGKRPSRGNIDREVLTALVRPYPRVVAGTPVHFGFDPAARRFSLEYSTRRVAGRTRFPPGSKTEVYVPRLHYPNGYRVEVDGAAVSSRLGARRLVLRSRRGERTVVLGVTPAG